MAEDLIRRHFECTDSLLWRAQHQLWPNILSNLLLECVTTSGWMHSEFSGVSRILPKFSAEVRLFGDHFGDHFALIYSYLVETFDVQAK